VLAVALACLVASTGCLAGVDTGDAGTATEWTVEVVEVVDGDTLKVQFPDGRVENVRLLGVDTPEVHTDVSPAEFEGVPETDDGRAWLRDWGHRASEWMRQRVAEDEVAIRTDPAADRRGSYGRLLVSVEADGEDVNAELLERGYARMYDGAFAERDRYEGLEATARSQAAGLWGYTDGAGGELAGSSGDGAGGELAGSSGDGGAVGDTGLAVDAVHEDADGPDGENRNDEYVVLENSGNRTVDLSGWTLRDDADHVYEFPDGFELKPGAKVTIYTGSGTDTDDALYWDEKGPVWNNDGDVVSVRTENGTTVVEYAY